VAAGLAGWGVGEGGGAVTATAGVGTLTAGSFLSSFFSSFFSAAFGLSGSTRCTAPNFCRPYDRHEH
jgi:hypothetical protein